MQAKDAHHTIEKARSNVTVEEELLCFCDNLRYLRQLYGLTLDEMAEKLKLTHEELAAAEMGITDQLPAGVLVEVYENFGLKASTMMEVRLGPRKLC